MQIDPAKTTNCIFLSYADAPGIKTLASDNIRDIPSVDTAVPCCPQRFPEGKNSLHLPFYQTNTSQYCTLYAQYREHNRGRQHLQTECPGYCQMQAFFIPGASAYDRKIQFVVFRWIRGFLRALETGSVENAAFRKEEQGVQPDRAVLNLL